MFSKQRKSRGPEKPTNASALAAASAIGKALDNNGKKVDRSKLPDYNHSSPLGSRDPSLRGSRRSSLQVDGPSGIRNNSLVKNGHPDESIISGIRRRTSIRSSNSRSNSAVRSHSLQSPGGPAGRDRSSRIAPEDHNSDPQRAFREFGGQQTTGIIHEQQNENPKTIKKYIPTSHGLVAVEVPFEKHVEEQRRRSSLRRSISSNSLSVSRQNSLTRRSSWQSQPNAQQKRHSSLTNSSVKSSSSRSRQVDSQPLMQTYVQEETEQELTQDIVRPLQIPRDEIGQKPSQISSPELQQPRKKDIALPEKVVDTEQDEMEVEASAEEATRVAIESASHQQEASVDKSSDIPRETNVEKSLGTLQEVDASKATGGLQEANPAKAEENPEKPKVVVEEETEPVVGSTESIEEAKMSEFLDQLDSEEDGPSNDLFDASDEIEIKPVEDSNNASHPTVEPVSAPTPSLAQHLRAANPYLNQPESTLSRESQGTDSKVDTKSDSKNLFKVPSPMKSALKKTHTQSSATSSIYSENSPANQAYLSLTTAENTRLNAKLASSESLVHRQNSKHLSRPHSVANPSNFRSNSPSAREAAKTKRHSNVPKPVSENRQSLYRSTREPNKPLATAATAAARTSATNNKAKKESVKNKALEHVKNQGTAMKENGGTKDASNSYLYPKEPPRKRSSFEKNRNLDSNLGFKKLSLRDENMSEPGFSQHHSSGEFRSSIPTTPKKQNVAASSSEGYQGFLENSGWKSRFHDSDSDDDTIPFSSTGTSRSTQPTVSSPNVENSGNSKGFSIFKNKGKTTNDTLVPPQPAFMEAEKSSANSTPNKVNKKWSRLSLRSSSTSEAYEQKNEPANKVATPEKRYHSNSKVEGFSYDGMKERTFREDLATAPVVDVQSKKKKKFGTKLKKLFGREK